MERIGPGTPPTMEFSSEITLTVNGRPESLTVDNRSSVLDVLRERLGCTGTKKGCDHGQCGACTILLGGRRVKSCLIFAAAQDGAEITTVEGLSDGDRLHPLQEAFIERDAFQCGYCTPGQLCSAVGMLAEAAAGWPSAVTADGGSTDGGSKDGGSTDGGSTDGSRPGRAVLADMLGPEEIRERMSGNLCRCGAYPNIVAAIMDVASLGDDAAAGEDAR